MPQILLVFLALLVLDPTNIFFFSLPPPRKVQRSDIMCGFFRKCFTYKLLDSCCDLIYGRALLALKHCVDFGIFPLK